MPTYVLMLVREGSFVFCLSAYSAAVVGSGATGLVVLAVGVLCGQVERT